LEDQNISYINGLGPPEDTKTSNTEYTTAQEKNLCLAVYKNGSRSWRFKQTFRGKRLFITIGPYPLFSLKEVIEKARTYKKMMAEDIGTCLGEKAA
jgi:hypothetical protein